MATDTGLIVVNLLAFYDFTNRIVVDVGAGGGQLVEYARATRRVIAVDFDEVAIEKLADRSREAGLADKFTFVREDFLAVRPTGDVVLFEFCLHQMPEPGRALRHATELAPDVLIIDHAPGSLWSWYAAEEEKVEAAWKAVAERAVHRQQTVEAFQRFRDFEELESKLASQGATSLERIRRFHGQSAIAIPMPYRLTLL